MIGIISKQFLSFLLILNIGVTISTSQGWQGIVPLKSTRTDVERIMGKPDRESVNAYDFPEKSVIIKYSQRPCDEGWNVAPDTVLYISINPTVKKPLADLNLDLTKYKKKPGDFDVPAHFYYVDEEQGLTLSVLNGRVQEYIYGPTVKDNTLRCNKIDNRCRTTSEDVR